MTITKVSDLLTSSDTADLGLSTIFPMYQVGNSSTLLGKSAVQVGDKIYLRSGSYTSPNNVDASVRDMDHLKLYNTEQVNSQILSDGFIYNIVSNGGSTLVATGVGKISYSTDNGITWSTAVNVGNSQNTYSYAVWTGTRFVIAAAGGGGGVAPTVYHSTNGVTWTASTGSLPGTTNGTTDMITDKQGRVLILNGSTDAFYSTDHGVSFTPVTLPSAIRTGFVVNGLWVFLQNNPVYYTAPVATPTVTTNRTLPVSPSGLSRKLCCSNGINLGVLIEQGVAYVTTDGITWSTGNDEMSYNALSVHYDGSRFYFTTAFNPITNNGKWVPYVVFESTNLSTFREMFLTPARMGTAAETVPVSAVGANNGRLFFATQGTNTLPLRYLDYKTTADFIGTNKLYRNLISDSINTIFYWRVK